VIWCSDGILHFTWLTRVQAFPHHCIISAMMHAVKPTCRGVAAQQQSAQQSTMECAVHVRVQDHCDVASALLLSFARLTGVAAAVLTHLCGDGTCRGPKDAAAAAAAAAASLPDLPPTVIAHLGALLDLPTRRSCTLAHRRFANVMELLQLAEWPVRADVDYAAKGRATLLRKPNVSVVRLVVDYSGDAGWTCGVAVEQTRAILDALAAMPDVRCVEVFTGGPAAARMQQQQQQQQQLGSPADGDAVLLQLLWLLVPALPPHVRLWHFRIRVRRLSTAVDAAATVLQREKPASLCVTVDDNDSVPTDRVVSWLEALAAAQPRGVDRFEWLTARPSLQQQQQQQQQQRERVEVALRALSSWVAADWGTPALGVADDVVATQRHRLSPACAESVAGLRRLASGAALKVLRVACADLSAFASAPGAMDALAAALRGRQRSPPAPLLFLGSACVLDPALDAFLDALLPETACAVALLAPDPASAAVACRAIARLRAELQCRVARCRYSLD
jgi:hypothetical protein